MAFAFLWGQPNDPTCNEEQSDADRHIEKRPPEKSSASGCAGANASETVDDTARRRRPINRNDLGRDHA
jgi:hypothetical protein